MYEFPNDFVAHRTLDPAGALEYVRAAAMKPREQGAADGQQPDTLRVVVFPAGSIEVRVYLDAAGPRKIQLHVGWDGERDLTGHDDGACDSDEASVVAAYLDSPADALALADCLRQAAGLARELQAEGRVAA